jgi:urate oxidase
MPQETPQVVLSRDRYGKAEVRLLHVDRHGPRHEITDLNVTVTLAGDMAATYLTGDNAGVLTTDAQKNTVYALARDGVRSSGWPAPGSPAPARTATAAPRSWPAWMT